MDLKKLNIAEHFKRYEFIVNASGDFMSLIRNDYTYVAVNRAYCNAHKKKARDIIGKTVAEIWGSDIFTKCIRPNLDRCLAGEKIYYKDWFKFGPLGMRYMEVNYFPYRDSDNKITHCAVVSHDITDLKTKEEQLSKAMDELELRVKERTKELERANKTLRQEIIQKKEAELEIRNAHFQIKQLLGSIKSIIIGLSTDMKILHFNPTASAVFGLPAEKALNHYLKDCPIAWDWTIIEEALQQCIKNKEPIRLDDINYTNKKGKGRMLGLNVNPIFNEFNVLDGLILWGTDITSRKNLEAQLSQAQKLEAIGQLAAGIAHEINTPTQYIGNNTQFLKDSFNNLKSYIMALQNLFNLAEDNSFQPELLKKISEIRDEIDFNYLIEEIPKAFNETLMGVERVTKIVSSMKEFSHPGVEEKTAIDLNRAIESTITISKNEWKYVADLKTNFDQTLPTIPCYAGEFNQVILNLIINAAHAISDAIKERSEKKGTILISTHRNNCFAEVRIKDTGTGIPEKIRDRIFDPFYTTKPVGKGTGQGLFIAHSVIVEKLKGRLDFETEVGKGTTFIVQIPVS